jgi:hypothetical protein
LPHNNIAGYMDTSPMCVACLSPGIALRRTIKMTLPFRLYRCKYRYRFSGQVIGPGALAADSIAG